MTDWEIVGVREGATREEVERAYRKRALLVHPDRGGTAEAFQRLVAARDRILAGAPATEEKQTCGQCHGAGKLRVVHGFDVLVMPCGDCGGEGEV